MAELPTPQGTPMSKSSEETKTYTRLTFEEVMAQLAKLLGTTEEEIIKIMSDIDDGTREELLYALDIYRTYHYSFLLTYIFDTLKMLISRNRAGRTGIEETIKRAIIGSESESEKTRLQKLRDLFR